MQQRMATVVSTALTALALSGCGAQQTPAATPSSQSLDRQSLASTSPSAVATADPAPTVAAESPSFEPEQQLPTTGLPSSEFCQSAEKYLSKFQGLPQTQPAPASTQDPAVAGSCTYTTPELSTRIASLVALNLSDSEGIANAKQVCNGESRTPADASQIDGDWARSRGWSGWAGTMSDKPMAVLCTDAHYYTAFVSGVPEATPEDALNLILVAVD